MPHRLQSIRCSNSLFSGIVVSCMLLQAIAITAGHAQTPAVAPGPTDASAAAGTPSPTAASAATGTPTVGSTLMADAPSPAGSPGSAPGSGDSAATHGGAAAGAPPKPPQAGTPMGLQPSLGIGISPIKNVLGPHFSPFVEARIRFEDRISRGFGELATIDPTDILCRLRFGLIWQDGANTGLVQFQGADTFPLQSGGKQSNRHADIHQLFYNRSDLLDGKLNIRVGRQELSYGDERLIGTGNFLQSPRTFDAARLVIGSPGNTLDLFGSHTVAFLTPQPQFYFSGLWKSWSSTKSGEFDLFYLRKDNDQFVDLHRNTFGTYLRHPVTKAFGVEFDGVGQIGTEASKDVGAYAGHLMLSEKVTPPSALSAPLKNLTFYGEGDYASGTGTKAGGDSGTFDPLFATPHGKFGQIDYQSWKNMTEIRVGAASQPVAGLTTSIDVLSFGLASAHDFWYRANYAPFFTAIQQDRTKSYGTDVGRELDLAATYRANRHATFYGGVFTFFPGSFVKNVTGKSDSSTWFFMQSTLTY